MKKITAQVIFTKNFGNFYLKLVTMTIGIGVNGLSS